MAKILVTGAGGFIGSHLTEYLVKNGHKVRALIHYNSWNFWGWLKNLNVLMILKYSQGYTRLRFCS